MSYLVKAGMATLSAGAVGGVAYSGYYHFSKDSFSDKLGVSVLKLTSKDDQTAWSERFKELNESNEKIKNSINATKWEDLQSLCNNQSTTKFNKEEDATFQNFKSFCTWKVGDKLEEEIPSDTDEKEEKWAQAHTKLKKKNKAELPKDLQKVNDLPEAPADDSTKTKMKEWCVATYKNMWTSDKDLELVGEICKLP